MSLKINSTATLFETFLGEPAYWEYQQKDLDGNSIDTSSYVLEWSLNDAGGGDVLPPIIGTPGWDDNGDTFHQWLVSGKRLARFRDSNNLTYTLSDCINDNRDVLFQGNFRINAASPRFFDNDGGPMARYIVRIIHYYDPTRDDKLPYFKVVTRKFVAANSTGPSTPLVEANFNFSNSDNSQYLGLI